MLAKDNRISKTTDYNNIYKNGKKIPGKYIITYILNNDLGHNRYGIVTSKKIGNAVIRNKAKRRLRSIIRLNMKKIKPSHDIVIIGRYKIRGIKFALLSKDFITVMRKSGLWCKD
ncbi:MAG TPA: ribonuclease P protein component [Syntrophomonadaceae bacterium]|nr:ribonuclease P protein component [Syntrophomonadaceae bacterium]